VFDGIKDLVVSFDIILSDLNVRLCCSRGQIQC
jgi:hypothetical protein